jgi:hypothetical protein
MKRTLLIVCCLSFVLTAALPAFSQGGENNAWLAIQDQRDARRRAELIESFIKNYANSSHRPDVDKMLVEFYVQDKSHAKVMQHADSFRLTLPSADNASKAAIFTQAMVAAASLNNIEKTKEYGGYALTAEPNNLTVMGFLAGNNLPDPAKALEYAQKVVATPKPASMAEANYQVIVSRMHGVVGNSFFGQNKFKEANEHFLLALQTNSRDHAMHYRVGFASMNLMGQAAQDAQTANDDLIKAMTATPTNAEAVANFRAKVDSESKAALAYRDAAMDSFARALAIGGQFAPQAKQLLDSLYSNKNKSLDGEEAFIAAKKAELGIQAPAVPNPAK